MRRSQVLALLGGVVAVVLLFGSSSIDRAVRPTFASDSLRSGQPSHVNTPSSAAPVAGSQFLHAVAAALNKSPQELDAIVKTFSDPKAPGLHAEALHRLFGVTPSVDAPSAEKLSPAALPAAGSQAAVDSHQVETTVRCVLQPDASDHCEYANVCVDLPPGAVEHGHAEKLHFLAAEGSSARVRLEQLLAQRSHTGFTYDFADTTEANILWQERVMPFSSGRLEVDIDDPAAAHPAAAGGSFPGVVTWMDDMYITQNTLGSHLWGWALSVGFPLFGAAHANVTQGLRFPPLKNLLMLVDSGESQTAYWRAWRAGTPYAEHVGTDRWVREFLHHQLAYIVAESLGDDGAPPDSEVGRASAPLRNALFPEPLPGPLGATPPVPVQPAASAGVADAAGQAVDGFVYGVEGYAQRRQLSAIAAGAVQRCAVASGVDAAAVAAALASMLGGGTGDAGDDAVAAAAASGNLKAGDAGAVGAQAAAAAPWQDGAFLPARLRKLLNEGGLLTLAETRAGLRPALRTLLCTLHFLLGRQRPTDGVATAETSASLPLDRGSNYYRDPRPNPRVWFTRRDAAFHPLQAAAAQALELLFPSVFASSTRLEALRLVEEAMGQNADNTDALQSFASKDPERAVHALMAAGLERLPHRVCARRAVVSGSRENMVAGFAEANHVRRFGAVRLGAGADTLQSKWPPKRILLVDRAIDPAHDNADKIRYSRFFVNRGEMEGVLKKYADAVPYTVLLDKEIYAMSLEQQARTFASHGIVVLVHGATEVNLAFLPPHSAVIEVSPFLTFCSV